MMGAMLNTRMPALARLLSLFSPLPLAILFLGACASHALPPGEGRGLTTVDAIVPDGVVTAPRPTWKLGDRFVYRRGGALRLEQAVIEVSEDGYVLEEAASKIRTRLGPSFEQLGQESADEPWLRKVLAPGDSRLTWPLFVGKRWACEYLSKQVGEDPLPVLAKYECDRIEDIVTPAGRFETFRIWRRARPAIEGRKFLEQTMLLWYAPSVGTFVRRFEDGVVTELESWQRQ